MAVVLIKKTSPAAAAPGGSANVVVQRPSAETLDQIKREIHKLKEQPERAATIEGKYTTDDLKNAVGYAEQTIQKFKETQDAAHAENARVAVDYAKYLARGGSTPSFSSSDAPDWASNYSK